METSGKPLIVTDHGKPTLEIRKIATTDFQPPAELAGSVLWYDRPFDPAEDPDEWEALT
ncbi:MAG: type II toxin-antitoxin system Phd/YefM family antitoxin [Rhizobiaceae bacterium]|nr:type II toxin-antitoxin system Phd/YefM family antitoxin [Rhizobiaceae bacterium]